MVMQKYRMTNLLSWLKSGERFKNIDDNSRYHRLQHAVTMFQKYDKDGNSSLDRDEFRNLLLDLGEKPERLDSALAAMDTDGNGVIAFQEFLKWLNWIPLDEI
uniref:Putative calcium-binding protein B0563.7-like protein n=1 Tax=Pinctada fucata TaxID=50426 RepID=A0A194ANQ2_PINFU